MDNKQKVCRPIPQKYFIGAHAVSISLKPHKSIGFVDIGN